MDKVNWTDCVRSEDVKEERNILYAVKSRKANQIGHIVVKTVCKTHY